MCSFELSISDWRTTEKRVEKISNAWYLVPFLLAIVSGIAAYLDLKDRDPIKARECFSLRNNLDDIPSSLLGSHHELEVLIIAA